MRRPLIIAWALAFALSSSHAQAVDAQPTNPKELAKQRFQDATQAYQEGRYSAAASLFEAADRLAPHASTRYNAATAWEQAGEAARAATGYEAVLALDSLDEGRRGLAEQRLDALKRLLGRVSIRQPLGALITVDHVQRAPVPTTFYLRPGSYDVGVEYRGTNSTTHAEVAAGEVEDLTLDLPTAALPATTPTVQANPEIPKAPPVVNDAGATQKTWAWVSLGASVALGGAAIVLGLNAWSARDRFVASGNTNAEARSEASDLRLATNLLWGGSALAGATGLVLLLSAPTIEF
jgi:tetratricopeptide (TPR) repeat protein